jgi:triphosphatase
MPSHAGRIEVEWQLVTRDVERIRRWLAGWSPGGSWRVEPAGVQTLHDAYWDTPEWLLYGAGYALRVRRGRAGVEATLKALTRARAGVARRREIAERLPDARLASLHASRGAVGRRLADLAGSAVPRRLFGLRTRRRTFRLRHGGRVVGELVLDRTIIIARRTRRLERVEVEVGAGPVALVAGFVATLRRTRHLKAVRRSKFEEGLVAAGLVPPRRR